MQAIFERVELKYLITVAQKALIIAEMQNHMALDKYGKSTIRNLYLDTDNYRLIRHSMEKPVYKEKLRLRSYCTAGDGDKIFVELKKKYKGIVYKRRLTMPQQAALQWLAGDFSLTPDSQIGKEVANFAKYYGSLRPVIYLSYAREAFYSLNGSDFRVTFDEDIRFRQAELSLAQPPGGVGLLPEGFVLMELKTSGGIPLWMTRLLSRERIFRTSFSKYGTAYSQYIFKQQKGVDTYDIPRHF